MHEPELSRAIDAATWVATSNGLPVHDTVVLQNSNKLALRLLPSDTLARVAPGSDRGDVQLEIELAQRLAAAGCPVALLEPRAEPVATLRNGFAVALWTFYESVGAPAPAAYADALSRLHAGMRTIDAPTRHARDRVAEAQHLLADRDRSPDVPDEERDLLIDTLQRLAPVLGSDGEGQLLHGEPHPDNVLATRHGPIFIDLETCCRGPVEFDIAHAPGDVAEHYPGADAELVRQCRILVYAMITAWRWDRADQLPDGRRLGAEWFAELRRLLALEA